MKPARGGAEGRRADRLHDPVADGLADRRADPAPLHGRRRGPALPRVRRDALGDDPRLGRRLADADADDVREDPAAPAGVAAVALRAGGRAGLRPGPGVLRRTLEKVLERQPATLARGGRNARRDDRPLRLDPQGILPGPGHGRDPRHLGGRAVGVVRDDGRAAAGPRARDPGRPGRREPVVVHRHRRHERDAEQRPDPDQPQAPRRPRRAGERAHPPTPAEARRGPRDHALHAAGPGADGRGPRQPHAVPVQPRAPGRRGPRGVGAEADGAAAAGCRSSRTSRAISRTGVSA